MAIAKEQAIDILDKFDFFQGQRAGRELWNDKPFEVQEHDIKDFSNGIALLKEYISDVVPKSEVERLEEELSKANADVKNYMKVAEYQQSLSVKRYHEIKRLKEDIERLQAELDDKQFHCDSCDRIMLTGAEHRACIKQAKAEFAREIFAEIEKILPTNLTVNGVFYRIYLKDAIAELKKKYTEDQT